MKKIKLTALLAAMFSISIAVTGCGGDEGGEAKPGGPGSPGYGNSILPPGGVVQAGQPITVGFSASQIYNSGIKMVGGQINNPQYCAGGQYLQNGLVRYTNWFTGTPSGASYAFANMLYQTGVVSVGGGGGYGNGQAVYTGNSMFEPGAQIVLYGSTPSQYTTMQSLSGTLTLPPAFTSRLGGSQIIGLAFDLSPTSQGNGLYQVQGGVLIYTSRDTFGSQCYHGQFLAI